MQLVVKVLKHTNPFTVLVGYERQTLLSATAFLSASILNSRALQKPDRENSTFNP